MTAASRFWRWPTRSRLALENEYQRDFIRAQQAEVEQLRAALERIACIEEAFGDIRAKSPRGTARIAREALAGDGE